jgi:methylmalonyl-CoA mutase
MVIIMSDDKKLFNEFPPVTTQQWEAKIIADLKGADYEKKLVWKTMEGINVRPYYRAEHLENLGYLQVLPGQFPYVRGKKTECNEWYVRQDVYVGDPAQANKKALEILKKGVTSLGFVIGKKAELNKQYVDKLLNDICLSAIEVNFVCGKKAVEFVPLFVDYIKEHKYEPASIHGSFTLDILGHLTQKGKFLFNDNQKAIESVSGVIKALNTYPNFKAVTIHGSYFTNAGASIVQSLAFSLTMGADYLTWLTEAGLSVSEVANKLKFNFAVTSNYFMEIAKFRAARLLWARIVEAYDSNCKVAMNIHAETAKWNMTAYDPNVNMLRATTEAMSAAIAGIDSMTVVPFDVTFEKPTDFAERIARNTQIVLQEESYLNKIVDPSAGSYYIETLTDSIAAEAWKLFLEVQNKGGYTNAFKEGFVQSKISEIAVKREAAIASRREILLGTNQFPNFKEVVKGESNDLSYACCCKYQDEKCEEGKCDCGCGCCCNDTDKIAEPLRLFRGAQAFEELRMKTDSMSRRPKVFMLTMGSLSMRLARSQFSCNFFACAGFETIDNNGFKTAEEGVKAALEAKADIVVLCSSDDEYAVLAPEVFEKLGNKAIFVVAGAPASQPELEAKGIKNFVNVKSNVLETLKGYQKMLVL